MTYGSLNLRRIPASDRHSSWKRMFSALLILCVTIIASSHAFRFGIKQPSLARPKAAIVSFSNVNNNNEAAFAAFVESLEKDETAKNEFTSPPQEDAASAATWQTSLDMLLDPSTSSTKRQILLNDLLGANDQIRESVLEALRERKIDPILTPTGKKLQDGTRAVARQLTMDILPAIAESLRSPEQQQQRKVVQDLPSIVPKIGERIFDALSTQAKKQLEQLQQDLANPTRIPERISKQREEILMEARNVFRETPEGLQEPRYKVIASRKGYEIRDYEGYSAAGTSMAKVGEQFSLEDISSGGAAFNAIAAYIFGANEEQRTMKMTTPVMTTSAGEMRFFLANGNDTSFPQPLAQESSVNEMGAVKLLQVPPTRLAVARFTGFVTDGEVSRQKDALLNALAIDEVEIDVPHGKPVPYFIFQYNPPYTLPIIRRNEIAIPVRAPLGDRPSDLKEEWVSSSSNTLTDGVEVDASNSWESAPSDVE